MNLWKLLIVWCLLFLLFWSGCIFVIHKIVDVYNKEIHQKGGLKNAIERAWDGEDK